MASLSPALKRVLAHRAEPPALNPRGRKVFTEALISFGQECRGKGVKDEAWMVLTTAALVSLNRPSAFHPLWSHLCTLAPATDDALFKRACLLREAGLKSISFIGIAKVINNLGALHGSITALSPSIVPRLAALEARRRPSAETVQGVLRRGAQTWESIYRPFDEKLRHKLASYHPDLPVHILSSHYGPLLSDPASAPYPASVGRLGTSLVAIGTLRSAGELGPQLLSHVFGLKKGGEEAAQGEAGKVEEVGEGWRWLTGDDGVGWCVSVVDRVVEAVGSTGDTRMVSEGRNKL